MPNVQYTHPAVTKALSKWVLVRDCLEGQEAVKAGRTRYLPQPNPDDASVQNGIRYSQYIERAVFYNVTQRTHGGLVGQVFRREPVVKLPAELELLIKDVDGFGVTLNQQAKKALGETLGYGRCGLFSDFPTTEGGATVEELQNGYIRPTITLYEPWNVINWRTRQVGGRRLLSLVVLVEDYIADDDGFAIQTKRQWRVLSLTDNGIYKVEIWRGGATGPAVASTSWPKDAAGNNLTEIPFTFIGAVNNDEAIDLPPLYDMAVLNIAHYRNSADYEESVYIVGQPTPYFTGLTRDWVEDVFKKRPIQLGSRAAISLPVGGDAGLLQADPNTMPKEAMELKEKQMISLGAKLVEQSTVQRTATESRQEEASEASILSSCADNVSAAYQQALKHCAQFLSAIKAEIVYQLNTEFDLSRMNAVEVQQIVANWTSGAVTFVEMRESLRKAGLTTVDDETARLAVSGEATLRASVLPEPKVTSSEPKKPAK